MEGPTEFPSGPVQSRLTSVDVLDLIADSVICTDEDGCIEIFNRAAQRAFGYSANEVIGHHVEILLPERSRALHAKQVRNFASGDGEANRIMGHSREVWGLRKSGEEFPAEATVSRQTVDGRNVLTVVHRDISKRKELEEQREAIARELDHRIRNLFSVVGSIVRLSASGISTVEEFKGTLLARLDALARTQAALKFGTQKGARLHDVLVAELEHYRATDKANLMIEGRSVQLSARSAQTLALVIHELATNSAKYGALSAAGGRIAVRSVVRGDPDERQVSIEWRESGCPVSLEPTRHGFGTTLIKKMIAGLRGDAELAYTEEGLVCRITLPLATLAGE